MRISLTKLATPLGNLTSSESFALLNVSPVYEYEAGKRTENVIGTKYNVADPETFEKFDVKVMSLKPVITQEQLEAEEERVWVEFNGAIVKPFKAEFGSALCTVTADSVWIVKD